jgi:hypothetical protein
VVANVTIGALTAGDTTASATVGFADINTAQIPATHVGLYFEQNTATATALAGITPAIGADRILSVVGTEKLTFSASTGLYSGKTGAFTAVSTTAGALVNSSIKVSALYLAAGDGSTTPLATAVIGTPATKDAVARTINSIDVTATGATGVKAGAAVQAVPGTAGSLAVAANNAKDTTVTLVATVKDNATTPAVVANAAFKVTVTSATAFSATNSLTINGTTYVAAVPAALDVTTDAAGTMTLTLKNATALTAGTVTLAIAGQNITNTVTVTYAAPVYVIRDVADVVAVGARTVAKGSTYAVEFSVLDQFGDAPVDGKYRLINTITSTGTGAGVVYQNVVGGKATISTVDANTADATVTHTVNLQMFDTTTQNFITAAPAVTDLVVAVAVKATTGAAVAKTVTIGTPVLGAGQGGTVTTLRLDNTTWGANYDARFSKATAPSLFKGYTTATGVVAGAAAGDGAVSLPIVVADSTLAAATINGAPVTVSGKGLLFSVGTGATLNTATDSITFLDGAATSVSVYSHTAGKQTVTVTSGAASKTVDLTFITVAAEASALVMGTLPAQAQAGRSMDLSATVNDKWGNAVEGASVAFGNTGVGYVQSTAAVTSNATGKVTGRLIVLQNDLGTSFLSATLDLATDVVVAKSIEFGLADIDVVAGGKRIFVNAEFAMGRTVTVTVNGKRIYSKVQTTDNAVELAFTQRKAGTYTVTVRMSGGIVATERVSIR